MSEPKTQTNDASVDKFLAGIKDDQQRTDCLSVLELMKEQTGEPAVMWMQCACPLQTWCRCCRPRLHQNVSHNMSVDVGESALEAVVVEGEAFVVEAHQV